MHFNHIVIKSILENLPHSCWNNIDGVTKMIGITVI